MFSLISGECVMNGIYYEHGYKGPFDESCSFCECIDSYMSCVKMECEKVPCPSGKLINQTAKCCPICEGDTQDPHNMMDHQEDNLIKHRRHKNAHDSLSKH